MKMININISLIIIRNYNFDVVLVGHFEGLIEVATNKSVSIIIKVDSFHFKKTAKITKEFMNMALVIVVIIIIIKLDIIKFIMGYASIKKWEFSHLMLSLSL